MTAIVGSPRDRQRERTRERILAAAWALAERDGVASLSLRDLAAAVEMRAPSLYTYFDGKAAIYDAMFAQGYRELTARIDAVEVDPADPVGALTTVLRAFLAFCLASIPRYQLLFTHVIPGWEPSPEAYAVSVDSFERAAATYERLGIGDRDLVDLWTAVSAGFAAQQVANDPHGERWTRLAPAAAQMFIDHVARSTERPARPDRRTDP